MIYLTLIQSVRLLFRLWLVTFSGIALMLGAIELSTWMIAEAWQFDGGGSSCLGVWHGPFKYSQVCMDTIKHDIDPVFDLSRAKDAVFPATRELWRFLVYTTLYSIWIERLRRLEDWTLPQEVHNTRVKTQYQRAITRFRNSTYHPDMGEDGILFARVRSVLADTLLCFSDSPPLRALPLDNLSGVSHLLFFDGGSRGNPGSGGPGSVIVQLHIQTHAACFRCVSSMDYDSANTTNNVAEYWGLVHGLRQTKASGYSPLHVVMDSAFVPSQLRTHYAPRKPHLSLLFQKAGVIADDIGIFSWGHHYRAYNKMADRLANIAMDTEASIQEYSSAKANVAEAVTAFLDNNVNYWLETSHAKYQEPQGPVMTPRNMIISRQESVRRHSAVRGLVIPST